MILTVSTADTVSPFWQFFSDANSLIWNIVIVILIGCALYFTICTKFVQLRIPGGIRTIFASRKGRDKDKSVSAFQAFAISLAGRVGTGNIAGVASAIHFGGPGAVFWMWLMALLGSATAFAESTLAQLFKRKGNDSFYGGPSYYIQHGLGKRWLGIVFSVLLFFNMCIGFPLVQSNTICDSLSETFGFDKLWVGIVITGLTIAVVFGGIQRISKFSSIVVPFMAVSYILITLFVIFTNITQIPAVFSLIFENAFGAEAIGGAAIGTVISQGIRRGLFSNEAGEGSTPNAAATADVSHPIKQGLNQSVGVFADTLLICSCSAIIILLSGQFASDKDGILLAKDALNSTVGVFGDYFVSFAILFFAFSTLIANYLYGEININFIFGNKSKHVLNGFRIFIGLVVFSGAFVSLKQAFDITDFFTALMTVCNLFAIVSLSPLVFKLLKNYSEKIKKGEDPEFHASELPEIQDKLDAWK